MQRFRDRGPSVVRPLQVMEEAAHMRVMPDDISSRAKRTARQAVEHPPSSHSFGEGDTKLDKGPTGPPGIDADGPTSGPPGINAGGPTGLQSDNGEGSSCSSSCSLVSHPPLPQPTPPPPGLAQVRTPPPGLGICYFVISLRDSTGEERLSNMNLCCEVQGHQRCSSRRCASTHLGILARRAHDLGTQQGIAGRICRSCPGMASNLRCR